jgi:glycosyltransferase involved in cell wall biosynthesis
VIVPTYNRAGVLSKCLEALMEQDCPGERYDIVVADDGSTDGTAAVAERFARRGAPRVVYFHQQNAGANRARNRAIGLVRGELLLLINDDILATPGMLSEHLGTHDQNPDERIAVLGRVTISPDLPPTPLAALHLDRAFKALGERRRHDWRAFFTCNLSLKKSLLDRGGLFEERIRYHEDLELGERLSRHGLEIVYRPEALGYHHHALTEEELLAIAAREARALAIWSSLAPHLREELGALGLEPALPPGRRLRHIAADLLFNPATEGAWRYLARGDWNRRAAVFLYGQIYLAARRRHLKRELRQP